MSGIDLGRDAKACDIVVPERENGEGVFSWGTAYHHPVGGIVDGDQQGALWPTPFEPIVLRAIKLDE